MLQVIKIHDPEKNFIGLLTLVFEDQHLEFVLYLSKMI